MSCFSNSGSDVQKVCQNANNNNNITEILNIQFFPGSMPLEPPTLNLFKYTLTFTKDHATPFHQTVKAMPTMI